MISMSNFILARPHRAITRLGLRVSYRPGFTAPNLNSLIPILCANFPHLTHVRLLDYLQPCAIPLFVGITASGTAADVSDVSGTSKGPDTTTNPIEIGKGMTENEAARVAKSWRAFVREWRERRIRFEDVDGRSMRENPAVTGS